MSWHQIKLQCWYAKMPTLLCYFRRPVQAEVLHTSLPISFAHSQWIASRCLLGMAGWSNNSRLWRAEFQWKNFAYPSSCLSAIQRRNSGWVLRLSSLRQPAVLQSSPSICWNRGGQRKGYGEEGAGRLDCPQDAARGDRESRSHKTSLRVEAFSGANSSLSRSIGREEERPGMGCSTARKDERNEQPELRKEDERRDALQTCRVVGFWWKYEGENSQRSHEAENAGSSAQADSARCSYAIREEVAAEFRASNRLVGGFSFSYLTKRRQAEYRQCIGETP